MLIKDIAKALAARLDGDGAIDIKRLVHPAQAAQASDLALAMNAETVAALKGSKAQAVVATAEHPVPSGSLAAVITVNEARLSLAKLTKLFDPGPSFAKGIHPTAIVASDATLGAGVDVGAYAMVGARSRIGAGTTIMPHVTIRGGRRRRRQWHVPFRGAHWRPVCCRRPRDHAWQCGDRIRRL